MVSVDFQRVLDNSWGNWSNTIWKKLGSNHRFTSYRSAWGGGGGALFHPHSSGKGFTSGLRQLNYKWLQQLGSDLLIQILVPRVVLPKQLPRFCRSFRLIIVYSQVFFQTQSLCSRKKNAKPVATDRKIFKARSVFSRPGHSYGPMDCPLPY